MSDTLWTCQVGQPGHICGRRAVGVIAVGVRPTAWSDDVPVRGVAHVCGQHWDTAPSEWDLLPEPTPPADPTVPVTGPQRVRAALGVVRGAEGGEER